MYEHIPYRLNFVHILTINGSGIGYSFRRSSKEAFLGFGGGYLGKTLDDALRFIPKILPHVSHGARVIVTRCVRHPSMEASASREEVKSLVAKFREVHPDLHIEEKY